MIEDNKKEYRGKYRKDMVFKKERSAEFFRCVMLVVYSTVAVTFLVTPAFRLSHVMYVVFIYLFMFCVFSCLCSL